MSKTVITIVTTIVTVIVTIILQRSFSNIISGINLVFRKPFKKGDRITLKYYDKEIVSGHVMDLKLTKIKIKTYNKSIYILPTNIVDSCVIINEDIDKGINHTEKIRFSLDSNITKARAIIMATLLQNEFTTNTDDNTHIIINYENGGVELQYNVRTDSIEESYDICSDICEHLIKVFNEQPDVNII